MWTLDDALTLVRILQPETRQFGFHLTLGGGVLNTGASQKDLDLFFLPLDAGTVRRDSLRKWLETLWGMPTELGNYGRGVGGQVIFGERHRGHSMRGNPLPSPVTIATSGTGAPPPGNEYHSFSWPEPTAPPPSLGSLDAVTAEYWGIQRSEPLNEAPSVNVETPQQTSVAQLTARERRAARRASLREYDLADEMAFLQQRAEADMLLGGGAIAAAPAAPRPSTYTWKLKFIRPDGTRIDAFIV